MTDDAAFMREAIAEAWLADYRTSPNPMVGCVVVNRGRVVGRGHHQRAGGPHAEVGAIAAAGDRARGADVYVTLEPCSYHGRTPACAELLVSTGVRRVVIADTDPNPRVNGGGIERLRAAGIEVITGVEADAARPLSEFFAAHVRSGRPFVTAKFAASLDGRIATASGESRWITGDEARLHGHRLRHSHDAIAVGVGTVLADDPALTCRIDAARQPLRVIFDSRLRTPPGARAVAAEGGAVIFCTKAAEAGPEEALAAAGATVVRLPQSRGGVDLRAALTWLGERDCISVLAEGGPGVLGSLHDDHLVDKVVAYLAPRLIGGSAPAAVAGSGVASLDSAPLLHRVEVTRAGDDVVVSGYCED